MTTLAQALKTLRKRQGLTQGQLAAYANVDRSYISQIENGHIQSVGGEILKSFARRLNTTTDFLLGLTANPFPPDQSTTSDSLLEYELLEHFRKLDFEGQRYALAQLRLYVDHQQPPPPRIVGNEAPEEEE